MRAGETVMRPGDFALPSRYGPLKAAADSHFPERAGRGLGAGIMTSLGAALAEPERRLPTFK